MSNQNNELTRLYGTGWRFPLTFSLARQLTDDNGLTRSSVAMSAGSDNVAQSLALLFQTQPGERIMRPSYGCDMQSAVFANMSEGTLSSLRNTIAESVARHEPRAENVAISVQEDLARRGTLRISVHYYLAGEVRQVSGSLDMLDVAGGGAGAWVTL